MIFSKFNIIISTIIFILLQIFSGPYYILAVAPFGYSIFLIILFQINIKDKMTIRNFFIYCLIVAIHFEFLYWSVKIAFHGFEKYNEVSPLDNFFLLVSLMQGITSLSIFLCFAWITKKFLKRTIFYSFFAGLISFTLTYYFQIFILRDSVLSLHYMPSLYNYWIWQLNLSIALNLYIIELKKTQNLL